MPIKIKNTKDQSRDEVKCLVFGRSGIGKTRLLATAPKPLIISAEKGLLSLAHDDIDYVEVKNIHDIDEVYNHCLASDYKTICLDTVSEITELLLAELKPEEKDGRQAYLKMGDAALEMIRKFRDLEGKNVVFNAKMRRYEDSSTGIVKFEPSLPGRMVPDNIAYMFDEVFCMQIKKIKGVEYKGLQTGIDRNIDCKDRSGTLSPFEKPDLTGIFDKIKAGKI